MRIYYAQFTGRKNDAMFEMLFKSKIDLLDQSLKDC